MKKSNKLYFICSIIIIFILFIGIFTCKKFYEHEKRQSELIQTLYDNISNSSENNITEDKNVNNAELYSFDLDNGIFVGEASDGEMGDYQLTFFGLLNSFEGLMIGKGIEGEVWGESLEVYSDKILVVDRQNQITVGEYTVDFVPKDYIGINVLANIDGTASIEIYSNGFNFKQENVSWNGVNGTVYVESVGNTIVEDCSLSYYCNGWNKSTWVYGDSYFSMCDKDRWTSYLIEDGADDIMLTARSGKGSEEALENLKRQLTFGTPDRIVWCMGMNDGDLESAINESYYNCVQELMSICNEKNIELILATIPTCPYWYNEYKNEFVKNSGYRYIDFANAVGAYDSKEWYANMLEEGTDRIHPTEEGAKALYETAVASVPELLRR